MFSYESDAIKEKDQKTHQQTHNSHNGLEVLLIGERLCRDACQLGAELGENRVPLGLHVMLLLVDDRVRVQVEDDPRELHEVIKRKQRSSRFLQKKRGDDTLWTALSYHQACVAHHPRQQSVQAIELHTVLLLVDGRVRVQARDDPWELLEAKSLRVKQHPNDVGR